LAQLVPQQHRAERAGVAGERHRHDPLLELARAQPGWNAGHQLHQRLALDRPLHASDDLGRAAAGEHHRAAGRAGVVDQPVERLTARLLVYVERRDRQDVARADALRHLVERTGESGRSARSGVDAYVVRGIDRPRARSRALCQTPTLSLIAMPSSTEPDVVASWLR
jgi:hypothetical protein